MIEPFVITQEDSDVTQSDTTAASMTDLFKYRVPKGWSILLRPTDVIAMDLDETDGTVAQNTDEVKLEIRDSTETEKKTVLGPILYSRFAASGVGEWRDEDKLVKLGIGTEVEVNQREYIVLMTNGTAITDKDLSAFDLRVHRRR